MTEVVEQGAERRGRGARLGHRQLAGRAHGRGRAGGAPSWAWRRHGRASIYSLMARDWVESPEMTEALEREGGRLVRPRGRDPERQVRDGRRRPDGGRGRRLALGGRRAAARELAALAAEVGTTPAALAMAFVLTNSLVATILFGATSPSQQHRENMAEEAREVVGTLAESLRAPTGDRSLIVVHSQLMPFVEPSEILIALTPGADTALVVRNALVAGPVPARRTALGSSTGLLVGRRVGLRHRRHAQWPDRGLQRREAGGRAVPRLARPEGHPQRQPERLQGQRAPTASPGQGLLRSSTCKAERVSPPLLPQFVSPDDPALLVALLMTAIAAGRRRSVALDLRDGPHAARGDVLHLRRCAAPGPRHRRRPHRAWAAPRVDAALTVVTSTSASSAIGERAGGEGRRSEV